MINKEVSELHVGNQWSFASMTVLVIEEPQIIYLKFDLFPLFAEN